MVNNSSNASRRLATKSDTKSVHVCSDYGKMIAACDQFNSQIKNKVWPHRHGGRGHLGKTGKFSSFALGLRFQCLMLKAEVVLIIITSCVRQIIAISIPLPRMQTIVSTSSMQS